ncbi:MAG: elongation factor Ts [bacterium]|nr:elongation factor Ts [bacterium]
MTEKISTEAIKVLRDKTFASIAMVRKALIEAEGDETKALEVLKKLGHEAAAKKGDRDLGAGRVGAYVHSGDRVGVLVEVRSETDFVSRNEAFGELTHNLAMHIAAMNPQSAEELLSQSFVKDPADTISDLVKKASAQFGENIQIGQFVRFEI